MSKKLVRNGSRRLRLVAVLWVDAKIHGEEESPLPLPTPALTIGYLAEEDATGITVAFEVFADGDMRQKQAIPRKMVLKVIPLRQLPIPKEFLTYAVKEALQSSQTRPKWYG